MQSTKTVKRAKSHQDVSKVYDIEVLKFDG